MGVAAPAGTLERKGSSHRPRTAERYRRWQRTRRDSVARSMIAARLPFVAVALVCATFGVYLASISGSEARLDRASTALVEDRSADALAELDGLKGEAGRRAAGPRGYAYARRGQFKLSRAAFQKAARRDPNNWVLQRDYAIVLLRLGQRAKAQARMRRARSLNPRMPLPPGFVASK